MCRYLKAALGAVFFLMTVIVTPSWAWTPVGPWGGVVHDLVNGSAGSDTLFAATGNGIYQYPNDDVDGYQWGDFPATLGMRVYEIAPDPGNGRIFAVAVPGADSFFFGQNQEHLPPSGDLYMLNTSSGMWSDLSLSAVTAIAVNGSGELLAGTWEGDLFRFSGGITGQVTIPLAGTPVRDIVRVPGTSDILMAQGMYVDQFVSTCRIYRSTDDGKSWIASPDFSRNDGVCLSMGMDSNGDPLLGTEDGRVWRRSSGIWGASPYGTGLPPYPVIGFGRGPGNKTFAILRNHAWYDIAANPGPAGIYEMPASSTGSWTRWNADMVSTRAGAAVEAAGDLWIAFDQAGINRVTAGSLSALPGVAVDEGIKAVSLGDTSTRVSKGMALDPRTPGRILAFGPSGVYEGRNGTWRRLLLYSFENLTDSRNVQWTRDNGFLSGGFSQDDERVLWLGGNATGLFRAQQNPAGSFTYDWKYVHGGTLGAGTVNDIEIDPYDSRSVMWATGNGIYITTDDGDTVTAASIYHEGQKQALDVVDIAHDYLEAPWRSYLAGHDNGTSWRPGLLFSDNPLEWSTGLYDGMSVFSVGFNPMPGSSVSRAVAGVSFGMSPECVCLVRNGNWEQDLSVPPPGFINPNFRSIAFPFGEDKDLRQDVFAVIWNSERGVYWSSSSTDRGSPGEYWTDITTEPGTGVLEVLTPVSTMVDPKDGNLLWTATREGSVYTLKRDHFFDDTKPHFPFHPIMPPGVKMDGVGSDVDTIYLAWLAPGDDGDLPGWADRYELRCADTVLTSAGDFSTFGTLVSAATPHIAHREEIVPVDIADCNVTGTTVAFALRALDEKDHSSAILTTGLLTPLPREPVQNLSYTLSGLRVDLTWDVAGLSGDPYFQSFGSIIVERSYEGDTVIMNPLPSFTEQWFDSGDDVGGYQTGDTVFYTVSATDGAGNKASRFLAVDIQSGGSSGGGGGGGCFIATAAYGSALGPEVDIFRSYRDHYLVQRSWGRVLIKTYYSLSPAPARIIAYQPLLKSVSRMLLAPILWTLHHAGADSALPALIGLAIFMMTLAGLVFLSYFLLGVCRRTH